MKRFSLIICTALTTSMASPVHAADLATMVVDAPVTVSAEEALSLGVVVDRVVIADVHYLALAAGGVAVVTMVDGRWVLSQTLLPGQAVSHVMVDGSRLHAFVVAESVTSFDVRSPGTPLLALPTLSPTTTPTTTATPPPPPPSPPPTPPPTPPLSTTAARAIVATVIEVREGRVVIDHGSSAGFERGVRVKVISQRLVKKPDLEAGGVAMRPSNEVTAVVALEEAEAGRAMGILGRGDVAMPGDLVEVTEAPLSESLFLPRRAPFHWRLGFVVGVIQTLG